MKVQVNRLRDTLLLLQPVIPKKTAIPILKNVLLKDGKAIAYDLDKCVIVDSPEADGECLLPHQAVIEFLKNVPGNEELTIDVEKGQVKFSWEDGMASFDAADPKDFPPVPELKPKSEGQLDGDALTKGLASIVPYCATAVDRPVLCGVAMYLSETMALAAGDGFRMGYLELPLSFPAEVTTILPATTADLMESLWRKSPAPPAPAESLIRQVIGKRKLTLGVDGDKASFRFGRITLIAKLIEGTPPKFKDLIPAAPPNKVKILAPDFERALRHIKDVAMAASGIARLQWANSVMTVSAKAEEKGSIQTKIAAVTDDGPGRIAVNIKYLLEYCSGKQDFFTMGISSDTSPILFNYRNSPVVVMMPMFVQ